jgi:hypothetical protein
MDPSKRGGAHTDVLVMNPERLAGELSTAGGIAAGDPFREKLESLSAEISRRFIVKRGKIEDFRMQVVGKADNVIPRDLMSAAFGPAGYNLMPTVEKVVTDAWEAGREIPYFCFGKRDLILAPDIVGQLRAALSQGKKPKGYFKPERDTFLAFLDESGGQDVSLSLYDVLMQDPYFKGNVRSWTDLHAYQRFVRDNPLTREMEDRLGPFFEAPITVGVRDTIRWALGSRHPAGMGWERARANILRCFSTQGEENFLPAEITYYAMDMGRDLSQSMAEVALNRDVVARFAVQVGDALKARGFVGLSNRQVERLAWLVLDFHHGYPLYELEPYQGVVSVSTLKLAVRVVAALGLLVTRRGIPEKRNRNLPVALRRPGALLDFAAGLDGQGQQRLLAGLEQALLSYVTRGGVQDEAGNVLRYRRIPRTFYTFQERADWQSGLKGTVEDVFTLEQLYEEPRRDLLKTVPELAEKLTVFFTLVYRHFKDTGFCVDLRPRNAGRDIFILGIWGYVSDNLLLVVYRDRSGQRHVDLSFVDNRDQFKEYRRGEDRRVPLGIAKYALRLTAPLVEPALLRSIGMFTHMSWQGRVDKGTPTTLSGWMGLGVDVLQEVAQAGLDNAFTSARSTAEDAVDDVFTALRRIVGPRG